MFVKTTNGTPEKYTIGQLRRDNPQTSFPKRPSDELLAEHGVYPLAAAEKPAHDPITERLTEGPIEQVDGAWVQTWSVEQLPAEDAAARVRRERDRLLADSDWVVIRARELGQDVPRDWFDYRGDLRQLPEQPGFPHDVTWPIKPTE